ncbi:hypothetical protein EDC01DRAFT_728578 [Geopyxis carbonaria]|nr:hypothetical protein EDC01DRAFT_728578 [Geopyxis carbonaria]
MPRKRNNNKRKNNANGPQPLPVQQVPHATPKAPLVVYLPAQRQAVLQNLGAGWVNPSGQQEIPRAPYGANSVAGLAWSHNGGTGFKGWGRPKQRTEAAPAGGPVAHQKPQAAEPCWTIGDSTGTRPVLLQKWEGKKLKLYAYGNTLAPRLPDFFKDEEPQQDDEEADGGKNTDAAKETESDYESDW